MSTTVAWWVVGSLAGLALIWIFVRVWFRHRGRVVAEQLSAEIDGESIVRAPEKGTYRGATAPGYPLINNTGLIALTQRRLVFRTLTGHLIEVPVDSIMGVRVAAVFDGYVSGGHQHLIVQIRTGEVAFYVFAGIDDWVTDLTALAPGPQTYI